MPRSPQGPYNDTETEDGLPRYAYRAGDPQGSNNRKLRSAHELALPMILLHAIEAGVFVPQYPVYVVADRAEHSCFEIAVDEELRLIAGDGNTSDDSRR